MKIAYEYSSPSADLLTHFGVDGGGTNAAQALAVTAFDGEEPVGFGYMRAPGGDAAGDCCISVHPAYREREIDANIRKLLGARPAIK